MSETITYLDSSELDLIRELLEVVQDTEQTDELIRSKSSDANDRRAQKLFYLDLGRQIAALIDFQKESFTDWHESAVCKYTPDEAKDFFYGGPEGSTRAYKKHYEEIAIAFCGLCTVRTECLKEALAHEDVHAVRGGLTLKKIESLVKQKKR